MKKHWLYLKYVIRHKWFVFLACLGTRNPRLILRGTIHDWTKFLPYEWFPYVNFFYGKPRSEAGKGYMHQVKEEDYDFNKAWNHHQKKNDHHWQWWILQKEDGTVFALPMSPIARAEMLADWRGAGRAQGNLKTWEWWEANKDNIFLHPETREWVEAEMVKLKEQHLLSTTLL